MTLKQWQNLIEKLTTRPATEEDLDQWLMAEDVLELFDVPKEDLLPIYITSTGIYMYSLFVPKKNFKHLDPNELRNWDVRAEESSLSFDLWTSSEKRWVSVARPFDDVRNPFFENSIPLIYHRFMERRPNDKTNPMEFNQDLIHASRAYWVEPIQSFCRLDDNGDYVELFKAIDTDRFRGAFADYKALQLFGHYMDCHLVRLFDIWRTRERSFPSDKDRRIQEWDNASIGVTSERLILLGAEEKHQATKIRGCQLLSLDLSDSEAMNMLEGEDGDEDKEYASFIAWDWKNRRVKEISCSPGSLASYFIESSLPYETSPAFFKPEVLQKYKLNPDKYDLSMGNVHCRGGWVLRSCHINDEGQVSAYLCDLRHLPYSEQLYWKSFNEKPKAGLSERAIATDFRAEFWEGHDPLEEFKGAIKSFPNLKYGDDEYQVYRPNVSDFSNQVANLHYVLSESSEEWKVEVTKLAGLAIDALSKSEIRKIARRLDCDDPNLGSIKLLRNMLGKLGIDQEVIQEVIAPLEELRSIRSHQGVAHLGNLPKNISFVEHSKKMMEKVSTAYLTLREILGRNHR